MAAASTPAPVTLFPAPTGEGPPQEEDLVEKAQAGSDRLLYLVSVQPEAVAGGLPAITLKQRAQERTHRGGPETGQCHLWPGPGYPNLTTLYDIPLPSTGRPSYIIV